MKELIEKLIERNETIATMESCTGGGVANAITNIEGASNVLKYSCVTYSNEYKIKMGVNENTINKYSVYSMEVAREMAKNISSFASSTYGVGITGKLNRADEANNFGKDNEVFVSIYNDDNYYDFKLTVDVGDRSDNKKVIIDRIVSEMEVIIDEKNK